MKDYKQLLNINLNTEANGYDVNPYVDCYPHIVSSVLNNKFRNILDLCCGTNSVLPLLLKYRPKTEIYGIDLAMNLLEDLKKSLPEDVNLIKGNYEILPYESDKFHVITCTESFQHFLNIDIVFNEVFRVLKPGGSFIVCGEIEVSSFKNNLAKLFNFNNKNKIKFYSKDEITSAFSDSKFENIVWKQITDNNYICYGKKPLIINDNFS